MALGVCATRRSARCGGRAPTRSPRSCGPRSARRSASASTSPTPARSGAWRPRSCRASRPAAAWRRGRPGASCGGSWRRARRGSPFLYPRRGYGQIVEALAEDAAARRPGRAASGTRRRHRARARAARCTWPAARSRRRRGGLVDDPPDRPGRDRPPGPAARTPSRPPAGCASGRCCSCTWSSTAPLHRVRRPLPARAGDTPVTRVSEPVNYRDGDDPPGRTVLCAEIPCDPRRRALERPATTSSAAWWPTAWRAGPAASAPAEVEVARLRHAYPVLPGRLRRPPRALDAWARPSRPC